jgi:hypothetical protein
MSVNELIRLLQSLPENVRRLPAVSYDMSWLVELEKPRIGFRDKGRLEVADRRKGQRVVIL